MSILKPKKSDEKSEEKKATEKSRVELMEEYKNTLLEESEED